MSSLRDPALAAVVCAVRLKIVARNPPKRSQLTASPITESAEDSSQEDSRSISKIPGLRNYLSIYLTINFLVVGYST
jgi:hypothetical protein